MAGKGGVRSTTFKPGQSGNPKGRPKKLPPELMEAAKAHTAEAIETLAKWMRSEEPSASVRAAEALLSRAWGLPKQTVELEDNTTYVITDQALTDEEWENAAAALGAAAGASATSH
jgi:hypothetical protein